MNDELSIPVGYQKLKCPKCSYEWFSKAQMRWITCPDCLRKFDSTPEKEKGKRGRPKKKRVEIIEDVSKKIEMPKTEEDQKIPKIEEVKPKYVLKVDS